MKQVQTDSPRGEWPLGRIIKLRPDSEGVVRSVEIYCKGHLSIRTVEKLIPLEISEPVNEQLLNSADSHSSSNHNSDSESPHSSELVLKARPQRASRIKATLERRELIDQGLL